MIFTPGVKADATSRVKIKGDFSVRAAGSLTNHSPYSIFRREAKGHLRE